MRSNAVLWALAIALTLASAVYQRMTGPTYPVRGHVVLGGAEVRYRLARSHETVSDQAVQVRVPDTAVTGELHWRRSPSSEPFRAEPLVRRGEVLEGTLPKQPPGGKLAYQVRLSRPPELVVVPPQPAVTRFKHPVSTYVLILHVLAMFLGMLWSTRAGLAAVTGGRTRALAWTTLVLLAAGGFVLGPWMQHQAFGEWWTGVPWGYDLTDNKTLIAVAAWAVAVWRVRAHRPARLAVAVAAFVTLLIFAIPHSMWGTEIKWDEVRRATLSPECFMRGGQVGPFAENALGVGRARVSRQHVAEAPEIRVGCPGPTLPPPCRGPRRAFCARWGGCRRSDVLSAYGRGRSQRTGRLDRVESMSG